MKYVRPSFIATVGLSPVSETQQYQDNFICLGSKMECLNFPHCYLKSETWFKALKNQIQFYSHGSKERKVKQFYKCVFSLIWTNVVSSC